MERTNTNLPQWIKITTGTLIIQEPRYLRIKHKQLIRASQQELGRKIDQFKMVKDGKGEFKVDLTPPPKMPDLPPDEEKYTIEHVGGGYYNVLSPAGEPMNTKKLKSDDANDLRKKLQAEIE